MRCFLGTMCLLLSLTGSLAIPPYQGTGRNCVAAFQGSNGPTCRAPKLAVCCDASQNNQNCLTPPKGTKCDTKSGFGPGPVEAFCCDAMDLPGCEAVDNPRHCPGDSNPYCCTSAGTVPTLIKGKQYPGGQHRSSCGATEPCMCSNGIIAGSNSYRAWHTYMRNTCIRHSKGYNAMTAAGLDCTDLDQCSSRKQGFCC